MKKDITVEDVNALKAFSLEVDGDQLKKVVDSGESQSQGG